MSGPKIPHNDLEFFRQYGTRGPMVSFQISLKLTQEAKYVTDRRRQEKSMNQLVFTLFLYISGTKMGRAQHSRWWWK